MKRDITGVYQSDLMKEYLSVMDKIIMKFQPYAELYMKYYNKETDIINPEFEEEIHKKLNNLPEEDLIELNNLCTSFSQSNCWWVTYETAKEVHMQILEIWYSR